MNCTRCKTKAVIDLPRHNAAFCKGCFNVFVQDQTAKAIKSQKMFGKEDRILVAVSGGNDSLALWDILLKLGYKADALWRRRDERAAGGTEAPLHPSVYAAMNAGRALAPDERGAIRNLPRPFDKTRCGMVLGEGAGCLILEDYEHARARGAKMYAELEGWGFTCDAHSMVKADHTGHEQQRAARLALSTAHWFPEEVDYVNACGHGTMESDALETNTVKQVLGDHAYRVPVSSFKAALGHAFAASGAFQVIGTAKAMEHQFIPPTLNLTTQRIRHAIWTMSPGRGGRRISIVP